MKILYTDTNNNLCIVSPAPKQNIEKVLGSMTDEAYKAHIEARSLPFGISEFVWVEDDVIPADRTFRNAWKLNNNTIDIDRPKAEALHLNRLRELRIRQFPKLDVSYLRAIETNDNQTVKKIVETKQTLRDMPDTVDLSTLTLDELKVYKPAYLEGNVEDLKHIAY